MFQKFQSHSQQSQPTLLPSQEFHALPTPWERAEAIPVEHAIVTGKELASQSQISNWMLKLI
jgi:hypothetical protein